jgi:hypothetical protein
MVRRSSVLIMAVLLPLVIRLENRFRLDSRPRGRVALAHLAGAVAFATVHVAVIIVLRKAAYAFAGDSYYFGSLLIGGFYELQKDVI